MNTITLAKFALPAASCLSACSSDFQTCEAQRDCPRASASSDGSLQGADAGSTSTPPMREAYDASNMGAEPPDGRTVVETDSFDGQTVREAAASDGRAPRSVDGGVDSAAHECITDADCQDGSACNGEEVCETGVCVAGEPVACVNEDAEHCSVRCEESDGGACVVEALDADGDGHAAALCAAAPGDDCDDLKSAVFPGATEACDGLDNDCDALDDLAEGFQLSGSVTPVGPEGRIYPDISWSAAEQAYGAVWTTMHSTPTTIYYSLLSEVGEQLGSEVHLSSEVAGVPSIAWGKESFGVAWASPDNRILFQLVTTTGSRGLSQPTLVATRAAGSVASVDMAFLPEHGWFVLYADSGKLYLRRIGLSGELAGSAKAIGGIAPSAGFSIEASGQEVWVSWVEADSSTRFRKVSSTGTLGPVHSTAETPRAGSKLADYSPRIVSDGSSIAVSWVRREQTESDLIDHLMFELREADGTLRCHASMAPDVPFPLSIVASDLGYLVLTYAAQESEIARFDGACRPIGEPLGVHKVAGALLAGAVLARSQNGFLAITSQITMDEQKIMARHVGPNLCD